jgi:hypothetical protein
MEPQDKHRIDKLESSLYSRAHPKEYSDVRTSVPPRNVTVDPTWKSDVPLQDLVAKARMDKEHKQSKIIKRILWGSVVFFVVALGMGAYIFFGGSNMVSANNIDIAVSGPTSTAGGSELSLDVIVSNNNSASLDNVALSVVYPDGTKVAGNLASPLTRDSVNVGSIPAHGKVTETLKSVLFGQKDTIQNIKITLEYSIQGSSAVFYKDKNYDIGIASSPIIVTPTFPTTVNSGQPFDITLDINSNTDVTLNSVLLSAVFPFGYTFTSSVPAPLVGNNIWNIGDLAVGGKQKVVIHGMLAAQNLEQRTFQFSVGLADTNQGKTLATSLTTISGTVTVDKPLVDLALSIAGNSGDYVSKPGERVPVIINWQNNTPTSLLNTTLSVKLTGLALDRNSVIVNGGFYRSVDNTVIWDYTNNKNFVQIDPGAKGVVSFSFNPLISLPPSAHNQSIIISANWASNQLSADNNATTVTSSANQNVLVGTTLGLSAQVVRTLGPFKNTGPIPPQADKQTSYTIIWTLTNSLNDATSTVVSAVLPQYVSWDNATSPSQEQVIFDPISNTVTWNAGTVAGGTGFGSSPRQASFQVTLQPSLSQVGTMPDLVGETTVTGMDSFTGAQLQTSRVALNTRFSSDPSFKEGNQIIIK